MTDGKSRAPKRLRPEPQTALSPREREILELLGRGLSNKEIGGELHLSPFTVKNHLARIFIKLKVRSRIAAVMGYFKRG